jgi:hypothetical protein
VSGLRMGDYETSFFDRQAMEEAVEASLSSLGGERGIRWTAPGKKAESGESRQDVTRGIAMAGLAWNGMFGKVEKETVMGIVDEFMSMKVVAAAKPEADGKKAGAKRA